MNPYLKVSGLDIPTCAGLLGYSPRLLQEWAAEQQPFPPSAATHIASVLGVNASDLLNPPKQPIDDKILAPAVWFKLRGPGFGPVDRELVLLIRQLGTFYEELESIRSQESSSWRMLFEQIRSEVNRQASPREQGGVAARVFRSRCELNYGLLGIGTILRRVLRNKGLLVVESAIPKSQISGCAFAVGTSHRPAIFANNHGTNWFQRNVIILHELAHLIFDLDSDGATLDTFDAEKNDDLSERRAEAFAQEAAAPKEVLAHAAQKHGISWNSPMSSSQFALLVAEIQFDPRLIVGAAVESGLLEKERGADLLALDIAADLRAVTDRALSTAEYLRKVGEEVSEPWKRKRTTTIPTRQLLLPVHYVQEVVQACKENLISIGRAAHLLMISEDLFVRRHDMAYLLEAE